MSWAKICSSVIPAASSPYKSKRKSFKSGTASLVGATSKVSYQNIGEHPTPKKSEFEPKRVTLPEHTSNKSLWIWKKYIRAIKQLEWT